MIRSRIKTRIIGLSNTSQWPGTRCACARACRLLYGFEGRTYIIDLQLVAFLTPEYHVISYHTLHLGFPSRSFVESTFDCAVSYYVYSTYPSTASMALSYIALSPRSPGPNANFRAFQLCDVVSLGETRNAKYMHFNHQQVERCLHGHQ
jgi:hypothetical protein